MTFFVYGYLFCSPRNISGEQTNVINWFEVFAEELAAIREGQNEIRTLLSNHSGTTDAEPYGDFKWLVTTCPGVPASTLRIKSAAGDIPGVIKFGKRVLYEKASVLNWLRSQTRRSSLDTFALERAANEQVNNQLGKQRGRARKTI
ncbi:hypothetical protein GCM10028819_38970 [Spirosoma humi]